MYIMYKYIAYVSESTLNICIAIFIAREMKYIFIAERNVLHFIVIFYA